MIKYAIVWPRSVNGQVKLDDLRLVVTDVPEHASPADVVRWVGENDAFDHAIPESEWSPSVQLAAEVAPVVEWRGASGISAWDELTDEQRYWFEQGWRARRDSTEPEPQFAYESIHDLPTEGAAA
jgi:hypothetical protein